MEFDLPPSAPILSKGPDSRPRGGVIVEAAYAAGKMLDHSGWQLSGGISPSDIDFVIERFGRFLFVEVSAQADTLAGLRTGQRKLYSALAGLGRGNAVAIARHSVPAGQLIDTFADIESVGVYFDAGNKSARLGPDGWRDLVALWAANPSRAYRLLAAGGFSAGS